MLASLDKSKPVLSSNSQEHMSKVSLLASLVVAAVEHEPCVVFIKAELFPLMHRSEDLTVFSLVGDKIG